MFIDCFVEGTTENNLAHSSSYNSGSKTDGSCEPASEQEVQVFGLELQPSELLEC